jgi:hypothetical protein
MFNPISKVTSSMVIIWKSHFSYPECVILFSPPEYTAVPTASIMALHVPFYARSHLFLQS